MAGVVVVPRGTGCGGGCGGGGGRSENGTTEEASSKQHQNHISVLELLIAALRKSMAACRVDQREESKSSAIHQMEIGWPTDVQHLSHVTFDRFHGFLGLPVEFQVEIPCRVPSASVFGVSAESMQCSYDSRGNSVPTILLLMQERLYAHGGLKAEGIFRINPENSQEERVRDQLNRGMVPEGIEVHCLAGLIKAWFRELPCGVLDGLSPDEVLQCNTEDERVELVKQLKPTETALLNWAIDLMSDVAQHEESNKMNARNIAMMSDPLTALMHAVQVMNLLKTLITKTLRERKENTTNEEFNCREEIQTSCDLRRRGSSESEEDDNDEHIRYDLCGNSVDGEIEESFLKQTKENKPAKDRFKKEWDDHTVTPRSDPTSGYDFREESLVMSDGCVSGGVSRVSKESENGKNGMYELNLPS
ncbi:hypothetical protein Ccrd_003502 [Cynara cardunculus var. scolymus]|uniref:Rho-GAP domain-containing protein n=1 Tax=Cynara cardunculus var. scolymus TaxID=59895 RepID=A0A103XPD6_CYNCS|nr:hypothetical protein Ccrd_003502 [Cynara cardunculus var. scolymus]